MNSHNRLYGFLYALLGIVCLLIAINVIVQLVAAILGIYFLAKGISLWSQRPTVTIIRTWRSRFFDQF